MEPRDPLGPSPGMGGALLLPASQVAPGPSNKRRVASVARDPSPGYRAAQSQAPVRVPGVRGSSHGAQSSPAGHGQGWALHARRPLTSDGMTNSGTHAPGPAIDVH